MTQYSQSAPSAGYDQQAYSAQDLARNPSSATSSAGYAGRGAGGYPNDVYNNPMPSMPEAHPTGIPAAAAAGGGVAAMAAGAGYGNQGPATSMSPKQREAMAEQQRFRVANQGGYPAQGGSSGGEGSGMGDTGSDGQPISPRGSTTGVTVHEDAGAVNESEIPPT